MNKTTISIIAIVIFIGVGLYIISKNTPVGPLTKNSSLKNIAVNIGNESFKLVDGKAEKDIVAGSATKNKVFLFGEPVLGDLDKDGDNDAALLLVNEPGGSGTFYYSVLAIYTDGVYKATDAMLLGDRISPQTVEIQDGRAVYNFAERKVGESFQVPPSIGKSIWVNYDSKSNQIGELVKNFEGEADPKIMTLGMKKWYWVKTEMSDGKVIIPKKEGLFSISFDQGGKVTITTDCNSMGGSYAQNNGIINFTGIYSTLMYCEGSQEQEFAKYLGEVGSYMFTSKGELVLMIKFDSGSIIFK